MLYSYEHIPGQTQACPVGSNKNDLLPNFLLFWFVFNGAGCIERIKERCSFALINICGVNPHFQLSGSSKKYNQDALWQEVCLIP